MLDITLKLAEQKDEAELRQLTADMPMPGLVQIAYKREPDFFKAQVVEGRGSQTLIGVDTRSGTIAGMGTRSVKRAYINGEESGVGYLSSLRVSKPYRKTIHLARGYEFLRQLHQAGDADIYLSTMLGANTEAQKLTRGRGRLPTYHDIGQYRTMAISLSQNAYQSRAQGLNIRSADSSDLKMLVEFLNDQGKQRQFFPVYTEEDFFSDAGLLRRLLPEDILLAFNDRQLVGVMAAWDQRSFRQSVVTGYSQWMAFARPIYNLWASLTKLPPLPASGAVLNYGYLALLCIKDDSAAVCQALLGALMMRNRGRFSFIMAGLHERDPLLPVISRLRHMNYPSRLYVVCWHEGETVFNKLNENVPYLELGSL